MATKTEIKKYEFFTTLKNSINITKKFIKSFESIFIKMQKRAILFSNIYFDIFLTNDYRQIDF